MSPGSHYNTCLLDTHTFGLFLYRVAYFPVHHRLNKSDCGLFSSLCCAVMHMLTGGVDLCGNVHVVICVSSRIRVAEFKWLSIHCAISIFQCNSVVLLLVTRLHTLYHVSHKLEGEIYALKYCCRSSVITQCGLMECTFCLTAIKKAIKMLLSVLLHMHEAVNSHNHAFLGARLLGSKCNNRRHLLASCFQSKNILHSTCDAGSLISESNILYIKINMVQSGCRLWL